MNITEARELQELRDENERLRREILLRDQLLDKWRELLEAYQYADEDRASQEPLA